jgi:alpha-L-fucosidase 2
MRAMTPRALLAPRPKTRASLVALVVGGGVACLLVSSPVPLVGARTAPPAAPTSTTIWSSHPAASWQDALPVGNGRLGAMVPGKVDEETIQLNEDTYWSGGPYSTVVKGGAAQLAEIRRLIFEGRLVSAHRLFGRSLMGYPVEQQKYQSLGSLVLHFASSEPVRDYRHQLDLDTAVVTTSYSQGGVRFTREVFVSAVDQVVVIRLTASERGKIEFRAQLRGERNQAHSNYATDYFRMDPLGSDGLVVRGRSADYLGVAGRVRYEARLKALAEGGAVRTTEDSLEIAGADSATLVVAAATSFVDYRTVDADPAARVDAVMRAVAGRPVDRLRSAHVANHQEFFRRVSITLPASANSALPTDERLAAFDGSNDPELAALVFQFGRYLLISSSRPGTQPANLQGIWNKDQNPMWDSKYTTNINTEMNYWPAEVGALPETAEPLFKMIGELTDQGGAVAREHYGASGWVFHQNTDIWRVAAPMDGPSWGAFTTGGAWLCTHLWDHFLFTGDRSFLAKAYPVMKGAAEFFLDFLFSEPKHGWLVTAPSTSPENFPLAPGNTDFFDEVTGSMSPGTTIVAGSTIDLQIVGELFDDVADAATTLGQDASFAARLVDTRRRLAPVQVGAAGDLQEWLDDWGQREKSHRHLSNLWGLYPGRQISARRTPALANASRVVLEQRGLPGNGWSSAWKAALWARLGDASRAMENFAYAARHYTTASLFSICSKAMQVDGSFGMTAALAELLLQSHEGELSLLPALPASWTEGEVVGLRARGGFDVSLTWASGKLARAAITSRLGRTCRVRAAGNIVVTESGKAVPTASPEPGLVVFATSPGGRYVLTAH